MVLNTADWLMTMTKQAEILSQWAAIARREVSIELSGGHGGDDCVERRLPPSVPVSLRPRPTTCVAAHSGPECLVPDSGCSVALISRVASFADFELPDAITQRT